MDAIARWWDSVELWITGLPFIPQVALVLVTVVPLCFLVAAVLDRLMGRALELVAARRSGPADPTESPHAAKDDQGGDN